VRWKVRIETDRNRGRESDGVSAWAISCQCNPALAAEAVTTPSRKYHANTAIDRFRRLQIGGREWHSLGVVGTRSPVAVHGAAAQPQHAPKGEFVSGELAADCARFLAETRRRVEQRRTVDARPQMRADTWRTQ
jgi:hypothetical protein